MKTGKTLWRYALLYRKLLITAVLLLAIAVGAELTGPFIGKKMIDLPGDIKLPIGICDSSTESVTPTTRRHAP